MIKPDIYTIVCIWWCKILLPLFCSGEESYLFTGALADEYVPPPGLNLLADPILVLEFSGILCIIPALKLDAY